MIYWFRLCISNYHLYFLYINKEKSLKEQGIQSGGNKFRLAVFKGGRIADGAEHDLRPREQAGG